MQNHDPGDPQTATPLTGQSASSIHGWFRTNERILAICGSTVLVMAGQGMTGPILPLFARSFGVSTAVVGLTITVFALARLVLNLPAGAWADKRGRRPLLISGPLILTVGMVGSGLSQTIWQLLAWRFVAGAGSAIYMSAAQLYILDISTPDRRGRNLSYNAGALLTGVAIGPAIGGIVAQLTNLRVPFFVVGGFTLAAGVYSMLRLHETLDSGEQLADETTNSATGASPGSASLVRHLPSFLAVCFVSFAMFTIRSGTRGVMVPLIGIDDFGLSEGELGSILGLTGLVGIALIGPAGQAADRIGRKRTIVPTGFIAAIGSIAVALAPTVGLLIAALFLLSFGTALTGPAQYAFVADLASEENRGRALGLYRSAGDVGLLASPPLLGWVADRSSANASILVGGFVVAAAAVTFAVFAREQPGVTTST